MSSATTAHPRGPGSSVGNPRRVAAGKLNRQKRRGLTAAGRERLRQFALAYRPWEHSTGPRTAAGKAQTARNGKLRQKGERSVRVIRQSVAELTGLVNEMMAGRTLVAEMLKNREQAH